MTEQKIAIYLQNVMEYLKFLIKYPGFLHNQRYELSHIYNKNEDRVYNKMHTGK